MGKNCYRSELVLMAAVMRTAGEGVEIYKQCFGTIGQCQTSWLADELSPCGQVKERCGELQEIR